MVVVRIWDPIWLTVFLLRFFIHNVTYIYCAIISRVKCVACAKLLVSVVLLLLELSFKQGLEVDAHYHVSYMEVFSANAPT